MSTKVTFVFPIFFVNKYDQILISVQEYTPTLYDTPK